MSHPSGTTNVPASQTRAISNYIARGAGQGCENCVGLELEHFIVRKTDKALVPYLDDSVTGAPGVGAILARLAPFYQEKIYETHSDGSRDLIGLNRRYASITLEPGAQIEISISPVLEIRDIEIVYGAFRAELDPILDESGYELLMLGYHPTSRAKDIPLIPKGRYHFMDEYFKTTGSHGICMMRATASTQVSIDYSSEEDAVRKFRIANLLSPLFAFITDNSPLFEGMRVGGKPDGAEGKLDGDGAEGKLDDTEGALVGGKLDDTEGGPGLPLPERMARTVIWDDVDATRSMTAPGTFDEDFGFDSYAATILQAPAIFTIKTDEAGEGRGVNQNGRAFFEVFGNDELSREDIEHVLSLFFYDVRFKTYVEIRVADSLPLPYALAFTALIKGVFYSEAALATLDGVIAELGREGAAAIAQAKTALRQRGYDALVYGRGAAEWLDELIEMAQTSLEASDRHYLTPLAELIASRTTLTDEALAATTPTDVTLAPTPPPLLPLQSAYRACFEQEGGDVAGRLATQNYLDNSTAIYHNTVIGLSFLPKLYDMDALRRLDALATTTYKILEKVTQRFLDDPSYRTLFGFPPLLERLICLPTGYKVSIPIMRMDIFFSETDFDFKFCEFNTDGASAMNEDREGANALSRSATFARASQKLGLKPQELFEAWVDELFAIYDSREGAVRDPLVAIVDYPLSATPYEFEEFRSRIEARGRRCLICDLATLEYHDGALYGTDLNTSRPGWDEPRRIDVVYRRAVTGEILAELEASERVNGEVGGGVDEGESAIGGEGGGRSGEGDRSGEAESTIGGTTVGTTSSTATGATGSTTGAHALICAVERGQTCMIGGFNTHVAHSKQLFTVLHLPETAAFLSDEENRFVRRHVPYTTRLDNQHIALDAVKADKDRWIIKPEDGYASKGVYAGIDYSPADWEELIDTCSALPYIVQSYCEQRTMLNTRPIPLDEKGERLFETAEKLPPSFDATALEPYNVLTGLYLYGGRLSGIYVRAGQKGIIVGFAGGITVPVFLAGYDPKAGLALRTRSLQNCARAHPHSSRKEADD
ncbi:MAG: hypothetical protein LBL27_04405 [Coriobacteriales bacterium]|jgi:glutamate--cysteine ligase|nr:hypothetical protein [Coriobacteriales bacterium]